MRKCTHLFFLQNIYFVIPKGWKTSIVRIHGNISLSVTLQVSIPKKKNKDCVSEIQKMQEYPFIFPILFNYLLELDKFLYPKTAGPGAIFSEKWIGRKLVNIMPKIIERVYIVKLLISRVNVVSIYSTLEQVWSHIYISSLQSKWIYDFYRNSICNMFKFTKGLCWKFSIYM